MSILCFLPPYFESIYILLALSVKRALIAKGGVTLEVSAAKPQIPVTGNDGKSRLVYSLLPSPEGERDEVHFVDILTPSASPLSMMSRSRKNSAHRLLAVMLLLWGLVSEGGAQEIEITAEFRPSLLNKGKDGFENTTKSTGICTASADMIGQCKARKIFSIGLTGNAIQSEHLKANDSDRNSIYIKFPAPPGDPLKIKLQDKDSKHAKEPAQFTITRFGASYGERFYQTVKNHEHVWWASDGTWVNGSLDTSTSPCKGTTGVGKVYFGTYGLYHFAWEMAQNGICFKKSAYDRPKLKGESLSYRYGISGIN
ncbi:hypothetical protein [Candidatus Regiella insecticola]|uniref:hypothetical protein n=1 Tax=Candidatus Regiella insecticola TaxID=138073 RepID=UPI001597186C|nr:hypothetical protein [Candidatus Regiella insecticola]